MGSLQRLLKQRKLLTHLNKQIKSNNIRPQKKSNYRLRSFMKLLLSSVSEILDDMDKNLEKL